MSNRASLGGMSTGAAATRDEIQPRDSNIIPLFPAGSIIADPANPPLPRSAITQGALDILFLCSAALLISAVASLIGIFGYVFKLQFFS